MRSLTPVGKATLARHVSQPFAPAEPDTGLHTPTRDVHAWAALTVFAVTGIDPYATAGRDQPYDWLTRARDAVALSRQIAEIVHRALDANPALRPVNAQALLAELDAKTEIPPPKAPTSSAPTIHLRVPKRCKNSWRSTATSSRLNLMSCSSGT